jgi:hypothetical protein
MSIHQFCTPVTLGSAMDVVKSLRVKLVVLLFVEFGSNAGHHENTKTEQSCIDWYIGLHTHDWTTYETTTSMDSRVK